MFPSSPEAQESTDDPNSQVRYMPAARNKRNAVLRKDTSPSGANGDDDSIVISPQALTRAAVGSSADADPTTGEVGENEYEGKLSALGLFTLSVSMGGAQVAWSVELGYGTPFLLQLGLSPQMTSLVWLAGPISGLIAQPLIGAISDSSTSKYRRRSWIIMSTIVLVISTLLLAFCEPIAAFIIDVANVGEGDWDPKRKSAAADAAIGLAIVSFYLLDFALNALQASLRNLLLDITPSEQLSAGNAWHGRMTHAGNIIGFGIGFLPLDSPLLHWLGGDQFRKFCVVSIFILVATVCITCTSHSEVEGKVTFQRGRLSDLWHNIKTAVISLPKPIRRVCFVQIFAFMGWFPFLFYATTYIGQIMAFELDQDPDKEIAVRAGELAMLIFSIVAVVSGTILPYLATRNNKLMSRDEGQDQEIGRLQETVNQWKAEAARKGRPLRLPFMPFLLRNIWTAALLLYALLMMLTFFAQNVAQASALVGLTGICWAVACWVPFSLIMEFLKDSTTHKDTDPAQVHPNHATRKRPRGASVAHAPTSERQPLLNRSRSWDAHDPESTASDAVTVVGGGTVLGIHNLAIVAPQFVVSVVASLIFKAADSTTYEEPGEHHTYYGKNGVAWVLRFGGLCALIGAFVCRGVPPTRTEKDMRRILAEMKDLRENDQL